MAGNDDEGLLTFLKANTPLNNTEGERWLCPGWIQTFFQRCSTSTFFFFKRKHVHTDLPKKFRLKETVFEKLEPFSWIPYVFFGRWVLSAWLGLMLGILSWWNTGLFIPFLMAVFRALMSDTCHCLLLMLDNTEYWICHQSQTWDGREVSWLFQVLRDVSVFVKPVLLH